MSAIVSAAIWQASPFYTPNVSAVGAKTDVVFNSLLGLSVFLTLVIYAVILFFAVKYRQRPGNEVAQRVPTSIALETAWTVIPFFILVGLFLWSGFVFFQTAEAPPGALEMYVVGKQWMWKLQHPEGRREINELHVPVNRAVKLIMTSEDVIHSFYLPSFRIKKDVLPGRYTSQWFRATQTGTYHLFCAEYCGTNHSGMIGQVVVMSPTDYSKWLGGGTPGQTPQAEGEQLFGRLGCSTCHLATATGRCPTLTGLFGSTVKLTTGGTVVADESYIRESIVDPGVKIVAGYQPIMPSFSGQVSEEQLVALIAYIKSLRPAQKGAQR